MFVKTGQTARACRRAGFHRTLSFLAVSTAVVLGLSGCQTFEGASSSQSHDLRVSFGALHKAIPKGRVNTDWREEAARAIEALDNNELKKASSHFNRALKMNIRHSYLQFLNGLTYHLRGLNGESQYMPLAREGYRLAIKFDQGNWLAHYYFGLLLLDQREYKAAKIKFADAAVSNPDDPDVWYHFAAASYYSGDPARAASALKRLRTLNKDAAKDPKVVRALAVTMAALDKGEEAKSFLEQYAVLTKSENWAGYLERRLRTWQRFHKRNAGVIAAALKTDGQQTAQFQPEFMEPAQPGMPPADPMAPMQPAPPPGQGFPPDAAAGQQPGAAGFPAGAAEADFVQKDMVVVDVVIIRTEEDVTESRGVNLLNGLQIQFGNPSTQTPAFSHARNTVAGQALKTTTITSLIQVPGVTYSLNIANSQSSRNEVLARPTLVALAGKPSEFFSGLDVAAAAVSGGQGDSVRIEKEIGVKLLVTPEFLPGDFVRLAVNAQRTFLTTPSQSVVFDFRLDTSKTSVNANVVMKFGETLILSGLSERETEMNRDGVPGLQDVPLLQYFFSLRQDRDFQKSVIILLTPRRPQFTHRPASDEAKKNGEEEAQPPIEGDEESIKELESMFGEFRKTDSNLVPIFKHMNDNRLFREFRTGDYRLSTWTETRTHEQRLERALDFLYY